MCAFPYWLCHVTSYVIIVGLTPLSMTGLSYQLQNSRRSLKSFINDIKASINTTLQQDNQCGGQDCQPRWSNIPELRKMHYKANTLTRTALLLTPLPEFPLQRISTDLFQLASTIYLIAVDYFPDSRSSHPIINHSKGHHPNPEKHLC